MNKAGKIDALKQRMYKDQYILSVAGAFIMSKGLQEEYKQFAKDYSEGNIDGES